MGRPKTPNSISHKGVMFCVMLTTEQKRMLGSLARKEDCSMNRIVRRLIEKEYKTTKN